MQSLTELANLIVAPEFYAHREISDNAFRIIRSKYPFELAEPETRTTQREPHATNLVAPSMPKIN